MQTKEVSCPKGIGFFATPFGQWILAQFSILENPCLDLAVSFMDPDHLQVFNLISSLIRLYTISPIELILGMLYYCKIQDKMCQINHCVLLWDWLNGPPIWGQTKPGGEAFLSTKLRPQQQSRKIGTPTSFLLSLFNCPILADRSQDFPNYYYV